MTDNIRTKDPKEAAFYWIDGRFRMTGTEVMQMYGKKVVWFMFETSLSEGEFQSLRNDFRTGNCRVEPVSYAAKISDIKSIIREKCYDF